jgi:hypothetical protein
MNAAAHGPEAWWKAPRCGAKNRRGGACQSPAMRGKRRCRLHGGLSTGPRTPEGRERCRQAATKHGFYSRAAKEERRRARLLIGAALIAFRSITS